jgi:hypothetical protein
MFRRDGQVNSVMRLQSGRGLSNSNIFLDCHYLIILYTHNVRAGKNKTNTQSDGARRISLPMHSIEQQMHKTLNL